MYYCRIKFANVKNYTYLCSIKVKQKIKKIMKRPKKVSEPDYRVCIIEWKSTKEQEEVTISVGGIFDDYDDDIFHDCYDEEDFEYLQNPDCNQEFYIVEVID